MNEHGAPARASLQGTSGTLENTYYSASAQSVAVYWDNDDKQISSRWSEIDRGQVAKYRRIDFCSDCNC